MQLKRYTDYALRVLLYLGTQPDRVISINEIANAYVISHNHLLKVVNGLVEQGVVKTFRGKYGGLQLAKAPEQINIARVIRYMEGAAPLIDCQQPPCPIVSACTLAQLLQDAQRAFYQSLQPYSLADLLKGKQRKLSGLLHAG